VVTAVSPATGAPGSGVTVTGTGFTGATKVSFGTSAASPFAVDSDTSISTTAPAGTGAADVTVTTPGGTSVVVPAGKYTFIPLPVVTGIAPTEGATSGGTGVNITGTGFMGATGVLFGTTPAASFTVNSDTSIAAVAPVGNGTVDVIVVAPVGSSAVGPKFSYVGLPVVVAALTKEFPIGNTAAKILEPGMVMVCDPAGYRVKTFGHLSAMLPPDAAVNDLVEIYAVSSRVGEGINVSLFPPVGESINDNKPSAGTNADCAVVVSSDGGKQFRKVSATNWRTLGSN
jgi:hypothetical protein